MKKILIVMNVVLLGLLTWLLFFKPAKVVYVTNLKEDPKDCEAALCKDYINGSWGGRITVEVAQEIADKYTKDAAKDFIWRDNVRTETKDARAAWFPLRDIKNYIMQIEKEACGKNCYDSLGIRIYYGKYPGKESSIWGLDGMEEQKDFAEHHTLFMVPTFYDAETSIHYDFNPWMPGCPKLGSTQGDQSSVKSAIFLVGDSKNHGSLIPPKSPDGAYFIRE
jgi:hypothetical protein